MTPHARTAPLPAAAAWPAALLGGLLGRLAFPDPGWWPLAVLGVALWTLASIGRTARAGALLGLLYGLAFFVPLLAWSGTYVGALPWLALSVLQAAYLALLGAVLPLALRWWRPEHVGAGSAVSAVVVACLWVAQEALRDRTPYGGFPWGRLAFSQAGAPYGPLAALGGAPLVTFAVALSGALLAVALGAALSAPRPLGRRRRAVRALPGCAAALVLAGAGLLVPLPSDGDVVRVAGVQGDVPQAGLDFNAERRAVLDNHARGTQSLAERVRVGAAPAPDLVIWPENASDLDPYLAPDARAVIDAAVDAIVVPVLVGAVLQQPADHLTNASIVWTPGVGPGQRYVKRHPVPFGEYIPNRTFFRMFSDQVDLVATDYVSGDQVGVLDVGPARAGVAICFEVAYDDLVRDTVRDGADLLVVQTNNATFGRSQEAVQQLAMSRLRAMEHGRAVAHVSTVGISALIAPDGTVLARSRLFEPAVLQAALPLRTELTWADRLGGWPESGLVVLGMLGLLAQLLVGRSTRRPRRLEPGPAPTRLAPTPVAATARTIPTEAR